MMQHVLMIQHAHCDDAACADNAACADENRKHVQYCRVETRTVWNNKNYNQPRYIIVGTDHFSPSGEAQSSSHLWVMPYSICSSQQEAGGREDACIFIQ